MSARKIQKGNKKGRVIAIAAVIAALGLTFAACGSGGSTSGNGTITIPSSSQASRVTTARATCERAIRSDAPVTQATITACNIANYPVETACPSGPSVWQASVGQIGDPVLLRLGHQPEVYVASTTANPNPANEFDVEDSARLCGTPMDTTGVLTPPSPPLTPEQVRALAP